MDAANETGKTSHALGVGTSEVRISSVLPMRDDIVDGFSISVDRSGLGHARNMRRRTSHRGTIQRLAFPKIVRGPGKGKDGGRESNALPHNALSARYLVPQPVFH